MGLCPKVLYGNPNPIKLLEWFEYNRIMGVSKVFAYTSELSPDAETVVQYYQKIGFLESYRIHPASSEGSFY